MDGDGPITPRESRQSLGAASPRSAAPSKVVIIGAGFGGLAAAKALAKAACNVTIIDRRNYHLFQPLLYQVATAALSPADVASPIRSILSRQSNARVLMAKVVDVDLDRRRVILDSGSAEPYDFLVVATGARHAYFGHEDWEVFAPGLKKIDDATLIRRRILTAFELAEVEKDPCKRRAQLNFIVVGGGPTGVEMAGAIAELARWALARDFRSIDPRHARVILIEAGDRLLPSFPADLSRAAKTALERLGVEIMLGAAVTECSASGVRVGGKLLEAATVIWAAGVAASPAARWLKAEKDRAGRVIVERDLSLPGRGEVLVIGDTASVLQQDGRPVPGIAPAAKQMGRHAGAVIQAAMIGARHPGDFAYRHWGSLATIGRQEAVAEFGRVKLSGRLAWWLWGIAHICFLIDFRSRLIVSLQWLWSYLTYRRGARLITGGGDGAG